MVAPSNVGGEDAINHQSIIGFSEHHGTLYAGSVNMVCAD